ncbi:MAG: FAD-dependent oxidoreductase, partial [Desulfobacteraceae bacterium]|nr:FAD-dependent oxidoreductase [Desulfobacteraceae bacterium]
KEGRVEDIKPCVGCHEGCIGRVRKNHYCSCAVNPATGVERELAITPAEKKKSVLVIGGGPAGMEAARVSALRGHKVTIWDKGNALGGNLIPAAVPDFKDDYRLLLEYLRTQTKKLGITVELEKEATPELIQQANPDVVFVATGASHIIPEIEGTGKGMETGKVVTAVDVLLSKREVGEAVVVIGGGMIGCETALYLAKEGKKVTVLEILDSVASDMVWGNALDLVKLLDDNKVNILTNANIQRITETGVDFTDQHGEKKTLEADTVTIAVGMKVNNEAFVETLEDKLPGVHVIGDCVRPRRILNAIWEGYRIARLI